MFYERIFCVLILGRCRCESWYRASKSCYARASYRRTRAIDAPPRAPQHIAPLATTQDLAAGLFFAHDCEVHRTIARQPTWSSCIVPLAEARTPQSDQLPVSSPSCQGAPKPSRFLPPEETEECTSPPAKHTPFHGGQDGRYAASRSHLALSSPRTSSHI